MKKLSLLLAALLLLLLPVAASAYYNAMTDEMYSDADLPVIYGTLNQRMATRTGPSTEYDEPGTFFAKGDRVRIISVAFDINSVPWVQAEITRGSKRQRVYTGLKRFDGVDIDDIPREMNYGYDAALKYDVTPRKGPGTQYGEYGYKLRKGRILTLVDLENGYFMVDDYAESDDSMNRVWIPADALSE